jgi:sirohydrochlorin cobaltochelatase
MVTPMLTRGGEHAEVDLPLALRRAEERHPGVKYVFVWPLPVNKIAEFLSQQLDKFIS